MRVLFAIIALCNLAFAACTAPTITNRSVSVTTTTATVTWDTTGNSSTSLVAYGATGSLYKDFTTESDTSGVTSHSVTLTGLSPATFYNYAVRSRPVDAGSICATATYARFSNLDAAGSGFTTSNGDTGAGALDMKMDGTGTHRVIQGYDMYHRVRLLANTGNNVTNITSNNGFFHITVTGLPANVALHWVWPEWVATATTESTVTVTNDRLNPRFQAGTDAQFATELRLITNSGGTTPTGDYTLTFTLTSTGGFTTSYTWALTVDPATFAYGTPASRTAPSCVTASSCTYTYEDAMTTSAVKWCAEDSNNPKTVRVNDGTAGCVGSELCGWYYDGGRVYQRIGDYITQKGTGTTSTYGICEANIRDVWRDQYIIVNSAGVPTQRLFAEGLYNDYLRNGNIISKTTLATMATAGTYFNPTGGQFAMLQYQREAAYRLTIDYLESKIDPTLSINFGTGALADPTIVEKYQFNLTHVIDHVSAGCHGEDDFEYFMVGLEAKALIHYYEDGHQDDVRIPIVLKCAADYMWTNGWGGITDDTNSFIYDNSYVTLGVTRANASISDNTILNLLIVPMYAWVYKVTGDTTYQTRGATIWDAVWTTDPSLTIGFSGKQFSQSYYWSMDYIDWLTTPTTKHTGKGVTVKGGTIH